LRQAGSTIEGSEIAYDILAYLSEHPEAQDTLQGIVQWWLLEQEIKTRISQVERALAGLVAERLVVKRKGKDSQTHYRINRRKIEQINSLLKRKVGKNRSSARRNGT
jgi:hypothetical protein